MKRLLAIVLVMLGVQGFGQQWKSFIISVKGDTLNRVDLAGKKQGPWVFHKDEARGEPGFDEQGYYENDQRVDVWVRFSLMGDKIAVENYRWDHLDGKAQYFNRTGALIREETWRAVEPGRKFDTVDVLDVTDPSKVIDRVVVKVEGTSMRHGTWTYYDSEWGTVTKTENWFMDKIRTGNGVPGEEDELKPLDMTRRNVDSLGNKSVPKPQAIVDYEKKNTGKKKVRTRDGSTGN